MQGSEVRGHDHAQFKHLAVMCVSGCLRMWESLFKQTWTKIRILSIAPGYRRHEMTSFVGVHMAVQVLCNKHHVTVTSGK
jgi:hypothetical protein